MHLSRTLCLALTSPLALVVAAAHPAAAQQLTYQLTGVTFVDGATASGSFNFDLSTQTYGAINFRTTSGTSDGLMGAVYTPGVGTNGYMNVSIPGYAGTDFSLYSNSSPSPGNYITFYTSTVVTGAGTYALQPGYASADTHGLTYSGEFALTNSSGTAFAGRGITGGSLVVGPAAVPEAATTVSFGLLLTLGLGGVVIAARKKKARTS